jgi:hypothetical protein
MRLEVAMLLVERHGFRGDRRLDALDGEGQDDVRHASLGVDQQGLVGRVDRHAFGAAALGGLGADLERLQLGLLAFELDAALDRPGGLRGLRRGVIGTPGTGGRHEQGRGAERCKQSKRVQRFHVSGLQRGVEARVLLPQFEVVGVFSEL